MLPFNFVNVTIDTMTNWLPNIAEIPGPRYLAIATSIEEGRAAGHLRPGDKLPTHRGLAWRLGVTVGTVSRAYAEAERRGIVSGEVGRGTFVRAATRDSDNPIPGSAYGFQGTDLGTAVPPTLPEDRLILTELAELARDPDSMAAIITTSGRRACV